ncbi:MAG: hypothetical protein IJO50_02155, partial [Clostridia bacterium]|nr:hypothetical protein [Clostridia bacterium]
GDFTVLADYERDNKVLTEYSRMLEEIRQRGKEALGDDISAFFAEFSKKDVSEGIAAAEALLRASDARFLAYIENWKTYRQTADKFADDFYQADYEALQKSFEQELSAAFDKIPDSFFEDGRLSAIAFGEGFVAEFSRQMEEITRGIAAEISASAPAVTANAVPGNTSYHTSYYLAPSADTISAQLRAISAAEERNKLRGISQESR